MRAGIASYRLFLQPRIPQRKEHVCEFCGKRFFHKGNFMKHVDTHTGIRRFICSICNRRFKRNEDLKYHVLKTHAESLH